MRRPKFCIYGAGAIGGYIAALLAEAGADVSVVARGASLHAIRREGLRLLIQGRSLNAAVAASENPADLGPQDFVIIAVKAPALPEIVPRIGPLLAPHTAVVTAMNGIPWWFLAGEGEPFAGKPLDAVDPDGWIARTIPPSRTIGCVVHAASAQSSPGAIQHSFGDELIVGEASGAPSERLHTLASWLGKAGFKCTESAHIENDVWIKLWGNMSMNPISLLTGVTMDRILGDPLVAELCVRMMQEHIAVGEALGIRIGLQTEARIAMARKLGAFKTSMLQDVEAHRPVELDALLGVVQEIGQRVRVATPYIDAVLGLARLRAAEYGLYAHLPRHDR